MTQQIGDYNQWTGYVKTAGATYAMSLQDRFVYAQAVANGDFVITLPSVADAKGLLFVIHDFVAIYSKTYTITCDGSDMIIYIGGLSATFILNAHNEYCILYSNGSHWIIIGAKH